MMLEYSWILTHLVLGCGKFFEGTGAEMHKALNETLAALPDDTRVFVSYSRHMDDMEARN
jgi:hypothetical protein